MSTDALSLESATEARNIAAAKLETVRIQTEAAALEKTLTLIESPQPVVVPWSEYPGFDDFSRYPNSFEQPYIWSDMEDRMEGRYLPLYRNEMDLRRMRAQARCLYNLFTICQGAIERLTDYTIGTGWEFAVKAKDEKNLYAVQLAKIVQVVVDKFLERNDFVGDLDREIHEESRIDGECFAVLYPDEREVRIELVSPDYILEPAKKDPLERMLGCGHKWNGWWHGVHTRWNPILKRDDVTRPVGYHAVFDKLGQQWDYLPANRVEHIKRNVGRGARRGWSDVAILLRDLEDEAKVRHNTAAGAAILAAIVMIRQHAEGVPRSSVESMVAANSTASYERRSGNTSTRTVYGENTPPGTVKDVPAGMTATTGPMGVLRSPVYIEVAQYLLRIISVRWGLTEGMISGDSSNNNYASSLVAEGPFVKAREHDQAFYAGHFQSLIWKALAMYHRLGAFDVPWQRLCDLLDVNAEYASPASRDKKEQADTNKVLVDMGVMSKRTMAADMGLDLDEELANGALEKPPEPSPFGGGFGGPPRFESYEGNRLLELAGMAFANLASPLLEGERWITLDNGVNVKVDDDESVGQAIDQLRADDGDRVRGDGPARTDGGSEKASGAGEERGAKAIYKGEKYRTAPARAKMNIDQMNDMMKERGFAVGAPVTTPETGWKTFYPVKQGGRTVMIHGQAIAKLLSGESDSLDELEALSAKTAKRGKS